MERRILDYTLVPVGMIMMVTYHLWLLYRIIKHPSKTVIGVNAVNRRFWVRAMMEDASKNGVLAVQTLRNNIMASTLLASTAIMLSSLIAVLMSNGSRERPALVFVYGDRSEFGVSMKFFSILVCFLLAFLLTVQSIRSVNWGSYFWSLGLRAFYFSFPLFFWIFGPIPMFMCCFVLVSVLYFLDANLEFGISHDGDEDDHKDEELMIRN